RRGPAEVLALTDREKELDALAAARTEEQSRLAGSHREDEVAAAVVAEELRRVSALQAEIASRLDSERTELVDIASTLANHEPNLHNLGRRKAELETRIAKNRAEADVLGGEEASLDRARTEVQGGIGAS